MKPKQLLELLESEALVSSKPQEAWLELHYGNEDVRNRGVQVNAQDFLDLCNYVKELERAFASTREQAFYL